MRTLHRLSIAVLAALALFAVAPRAMAADNTGTGDIAGIDADLSDSNTFSLTTSTLALIKRAFLPNGTALASGASVPKGQLVKFVIYINNTTDVAVNDVSIQDVLDPAFAFQTGTLKIDNTVNECAAASCTALEEAAIFAAVDAAAALTDAVDPDASSYTAGTTTVDAGDANEANDQLDSAANKVLALSFTVKMQ